MSGTTPEVVAAVRSWLASPREPAPLVIETSGSTGVPKRVLLSRRAVLASVAATTQRLGAEGRWVLALPATYVAGLMVVVRSLVRTSGGGESVQVDYGMEKTDDGWKVYNVKIGGISLVESYRSTFNTEIQKNGVDGLIRTLRDKNTALVAQSGK